MNQHEPERRTLEEIAALYEFEPTLRGVYVEGIHDSGFWEHIATEALPTAKVLVYDIDTVAIDRDLLEQLDLPNNRRGRVIALGLHTEQVAPNSARSIACIADSDFDWVLGRHHEAPTVIYTDYTSKDIYAFDEAVVRKFFRVVLGIDATPYDGILDILEPALRQLFLARATNLQLGWGMTWLEPTKTGLLTRNGRLMEFDFDEFVLRYLNKNSRAHERAVYLEKLARLSTIAVPERRCCIRGHDFFSLLAWYLRDYLPNSRIKYSDPFILGSAIVGSIEAAWLCDSVVCQKLRERFVDE